MIARDRELLFENGSMKDVMMKLALPTVLGQMIIVIYNMADTFFVGLLNDDAKMTAVTVAMPCFMILSAISNLFGIGGSSAISRALGTGEREKAKEEASFSFWGAFCIGAVYSIVVALSSNSIANLLGGKNPYVHEQTVSYILIAVSLGGLFTISSAFFSHILRAEGRGFEASFGIVMGGVLNIILDPIFMFLIMPEGKEVEGAAMATAISNLSSLVFFVWRIRKDRNRSIINISFQKAIAGKCYKKEILSSGLPAFMMTLCENISYAVLDSLMASFGIAVQAGVGVAKKVNMLAHSIVRGMAQGMLPMIAYSYASGNRERMRKASRCSQLFSVLSALLCMTISFAFADQIANVFLESGSESARHAARMLRLFSVGAPFSAFAYTSISFFQATGRGRKSFLLAIMRKGILDIPLMVLMVRTLGAYGAAAATPIADCLCACASVAMMLNFMKKHGQENHVEKHMEHVECMNTIDNCMPVPIENII